MPNSLLSRGVGASPREAVGLLLLVVVTRRSANAAPTLAKAAPRVVAVKRQLSWSNSVQLRALATSVSSSQSSAGGDGGSGNYNDARKSALAAIIGVRAKQEWTRLVTDDVVNTASLSPPILASLLCVSDKRSTVLASALEQAGVDTIASLLTAAEDITANASGSFVATGILASIDAGSLQDIAALRDKTKGKRKTMLPRFNPTH